MNPLIEFIDDKTVKVDGRIISNRMGETLIVNGGRFFPAERDALIDVLCCHRDTGSFAVLADTSGVSHEGTPPQPKYRPYTPAEAVQHLGREISCNKRTVYKLNLVGQTSALISGDCGYESYENLAESYVWADSGEPCGMKVEE